MLDRYSLNNRDLVLNRLFKITVYGVKSIRTKCVYEKYIEKMNY